MPWYRLPKSGAPYFSQAPAAGLEPLEAGEPEPDAPAPEGAPPEPAPAKHSKAGAEPEPGRGGRS